MVKYANDIEDLLEQLSDQNNCNVLDYIDDTVEAIKGLQARAETAEAIVDKYQTEILPKLRERAERAESENKGLQALTRLIMGKEEMNFCGYPIGKLQEFLEANPESKTVVFVSERTEE